jgi:hypothetical protein
MHLWNIQLYMMYTLFVCECASRISAALDAWLCDQIQWMFRWENYLCTHAAALDAWLCDQILPHGSGICLHAYILWMHITSYTCIHIHVCMHAYILCRDCGALETVYAHMRTYIHTCIYIYIYIYIFIHTYMYIHTYT